MNPHTSAPPLSNPYPPHSNSSPVYGGTHQPPYQNSAPQQTWGAQPQYGSLPSTYMNPPPPYHAQPAFATQPPVPQTMLRSSLTKFVSTFSPFLSPVSRLTLYLSLPFKVKASGFLWRIDVLLIHLNPIVLIESTRSRLSYHERLGGGRHSQRAPILPTGPSSNR